MREDVRVQTGRLYRYTIGPEDKLLSLAEFQAVAREKYVRAGGLAPNGEDWTNDTPKGRKRKRSETPPAQVRS